MILNFNNKDLFYHCYSYVSLNMINNHNKWNLSRSKQILSNDDCLSTNEIVAKINKSLISKGISKNRDKYNQHLENFESLSINNQ